MNNPTLSPMEMFHFIARERGWMFNRGGAAIWDEATGGAAAGGAAAGNSTFALVQIIDQDGASIILARGDHLRVQGLREHYHAEEKALNTLDRHIARDQKFPGGKLMVVVDQVPCAPQDHNCGGQLKAYAAQHGLELEVWLPTRPKLKGQGDASSKVATMTSMRTGYPDVKLVLWPGTNDPA